MFRNIKNVENLKSVALKPLKKLILENFNAENGKTFYSIEVTPKSDLNLDFTKLKTLPLFCDITFLSDHNLKDECVLKSPAFELASEITSCQIVNSVTCYKLEDLHIDSILSAKRPMKNFTVLRGDHVDENQKFKFANELIREIRSKSREHEGSVTIFAAGYPEKHQDAESIERDVEHLSAKVKEGVDGILTQVVFSAPIFCNFVVKCRETGIPKDVPIIPGIYIPYTFDELSRFLKITNSSIPDATFEKFKCLKDNDQLFQEHSLKFTIDLIQDIKQESPEFICGFHFFTMNNFHMLQLLVENEIFAQA